MPPHKGNGVPSPRHAVPKIFAATKQVDHPQHSGSAVVYDLVDARSQRLALDGLDAAGWCACWTATFPRTCLRRRWSA